MEEGGGVCLVCLIVKACRGSKLLLLSSASSLLVAVVFIDVFFVVMALFFFTSGHERERPHVHIHTRNVSPFVNFHHHSEAVTGKWKDNLATMVMSGTEGKTINPIDHLAYQEPWLFETPISRHRTRMPVFKAGAPRVLEAQEGEQSKMQQVKNSGQPFIAPCASVIGDVTISPGVSVWYGAIIRGDGHIKKANRALDNEQHRILTFNKEEQQEEIVGVEIGEGTSVQDNAIVSSCPYTGKGVRVGWGVTIGHSASVIGATVGDNVIVGMGSTVSPGAVLESGSFLAAGAVVHEGQVVKTGELWAGDPARKLKDLGEKQKVRDERRAEGCKRSSSRAQSEGLPFVIIYASLSHHLHRSVSHLRPLHNTRNAASAFLPGRGVR